MKSNLANYTCGFFLLGALATASAQTTWNYFISDASGGNSLVTWNVSGSLAISPGALRLTPDRNLSVSVSAAGIFADSYAASGGNLPTPDGSYFQWGNTTVYSPILSYSAGNAPGSGNDTFGLLATLGPQGAAGVTLLYQPGTESALIPLDFSSVNLGTYQSVLGGFDTPVTVNLTVGAVPEPSSLVLFAVGGLGGLLFLPPAARVAACPTRWKARRTDRAASCRPLRQAGCLPLRCSPRRLQRSLRDTGITSAA